MNNQSNGLKPTSLEELREANRKTQEGELVTLPSGLVLKIKRPSISKLLRDQKIPQSLVGAAIRMTNGRDTSSASELAENIKLMESILAQAIVEPEGMTQEDIENLSDEDKGTCFLYIQQGVADLDSFRNKLARQTARPNLSKVSRDKTEPAPQS